MVKDKAEVAAERQAQRKALREAMKAGRQQHMQNDDQNIQTSPAIDSGALPAPPSEPLPLTPLEEEASKHCHNIPSPPAFPLPELPPLSFQKEPHGSPEVERPASACSTASRASSGTSVEFSAWACASSPRFRLSSSHGDQDDDAASSDSSILDLEQSLHDAAEKSGILSDNEEGSDESRLRSSQIRTGASNSTLDLLDTVAPKPSTSPIIALKDASPGYSSSDEEDFDLSLDTSSVGTSRQSLKGDSTSRLSIASRTSSRSSLLSASSTPKEDRFPSPKMPFSYKAGLLSPPLSFNRARQQRRNPTEASSDEAWRYSTISAPDDPSGRPPPQILRRKASEPGVYIPPQRQPRSYAFSSINQGVSPRPTSLRTAASSAPPASTSNSSALRSRAGSVNSLASSIDSLDFDGRSGAISPSAAFPLPPTTTPSPRLQRPTATSAAGLRRPKVITPSSSSRNTSQLKPVSSLNSLNRSSPGSPRISNPDIDEFGSIPKRSGRSFVSSSTSGLRNNRTPTGPPPALALPTPPSQRPSGLPTKGSAKPPSSGQRRLSMLPKPPSTRR